MDSDRTDIVPNIVTEDTNGDNPPLESKARNRMVAEGYKYHILEDKDGNNPLAPIEDDREKKKTIRLRRTLYLLAFAIVAITCLVVIVIIQRANRPKSDQTCTTSTCVTQAAYIMNKMDMSVDPCTDFYKYTCGNWEKNTQMPPSKAKHGTFSQISDQIQNVLSKMIKEPGDTYHDKSSSAIRKAKMMYNMCMDEAQINSRGVTPALQLISDLGSWTLTSDSTSGTYDPVTWSLQDAVLLAHRLDYSPFFSMAVGADEKNSSIYNIKFQQSGLTFGDPRDYFTNHTKQPELKAAFVQFGKDFVSLLGNTDNVEQEITDLYEFEQKLAKIFVPENDLLDPLKTYHKMTLNEFQVGYLGDWLNLQEYMEGMFIEMYDISMDSETIVYTPDYFTRLDKLLDTVDQKTLANYIVWHGVTSMAGYLTQDFLDAALKLDKVERGLKEYPPRWKRCLSKASDNFGFAVGALYIEDYFDLEKKQQVESMFEEIRKAFIANLDHVEWMDNDTRNYAREKAKAVDKMLGFPEDILDPAQLDKRYENVSLEEDKLFESKLAINRFYRRKNLWRFGSAPDRTEWSMTPTEVNGYYTSEFNEIVFPAGILRPPLFNPDSPKSFNFGSFGMICGHELTHGFDDRGRRFDKLGNMRDWWSNSSAEQFIEKSKCFIDFYSNYVVDGTNIDGEHTLSENIADNGGMRTAYLAYQSWQADNKEDSLILPGMDFTNDQLFFIGMAQIWCSHYTKEYKQQAILTDPHSIGKYRVLGPMSNSDSFARAFKCKDNAPMNPPDKCRVW